MFVVAAANVERLQQEVLTAFTGMLARDLMSHPAVSISEDAPPVEAQEQFARYRYTAFPVIDREGRAVGVLSIERLERAPQPRWQVATVGELADRDPALLVGEQEDVAHLLGEPALARVGRAAVIDSAGRPVGVVSITDVQRSVRARHPGDRTSRGGRPRGASAISLERERRKLAELETRRPEPLTGASAPPRGRRPKLTARE